MTQESTPRPAVLVVEDEPLLRMMAVDLVEEAGFVAVEAADSLQAVAILSGRTDIRVVFTDIDLPGGPDGLALAAKIRDDWPPIEIIVTSGHLKPTPADLPPRAIFYPKPYAHDRVIATIRAMAG